MVVSIQHMIQTEAASLQTTIDNTILRIGADIKQREKDKMGHFPDPMGLSRQITELPHHGLEVQVGEKGIERVDWRRRAENAIVQGQGMGELRPAS